MKKSILWMLLSVSLVSCGMNNELHYTNNDVYYSFSDNLHTLDINEDANLVNDEVETDISLSEIIIGDEEIVETESNLYKPHPFAIALEEYFSESHYTADQHPNSPVLNPTHAFLVDVDGQGTQGVFAVRHKLGSFSRITQRHQINSMGRLFYLYDDQLFYKDLGTISPGLVYNNVKITSDRRFVKHFAMRNNLTYALFEINEGELDYYISLLHFHGRDSEAMAHGLPISRHLFNRDYEFWNGWWGDPIRDQDGIWGSLIESQYGILGYPPFYFNINFNDPFYTETYLTEDEFDEIYRKYGFDTAVWWWEIDDETDYILSMTK